MRSSFPGFMPRRRFVVLAMMVAVGVALAGAGGAQELRLVGLGGEALTDADLRGNLVVVTWASWSRRVRDVPERVNGLAERWGGKARVVTVNFQEDRSTVEAFLAGSPIKAPVFLDADGSFAKRYSLANLPGLLVLKNGQDVYHGKLPDDADQLLGGLLN